MASSSGTIKTRPPLSREERTATRSREMLEKHRLEQRREGFHKFEKVMDPVSFQPGTDGHADEASRFFRDVARDEKERREAARQRHEDIIQARRVERLDREEERWVQMENAKIADRQHVEQLKHRPIAARNQNSVHYDLISQKPNSGVAAERLRQEERQILHRADRRAENLYTRGNNPDRINPISGEPLPGLGRR